MGGSGTANGRLILFAASLVTLALGSVHAFSVLLAPIEEAFGQSRALTSLTYSLALVFLTISVLFGHRLYGRLPPPALVLLSCLLAAAGCLAAGLASNLWGVWLGYGVIFGAANGVGYGFALQLSAQANPERRAFAMGIVTAAYAGGASIAPFILAHGVERGGHESALYILALCIALIGAIAALLLQIGRATFQNSGDTAAEETATGHSALIRHLWLAYGAAVAAGLMIIGHASGIMTASGASRDLVVLAPVLVALGNMIGGILAGWSTDRIGVRTVLTVLPLLSVVGLAVLSVTSQAWIVLAALTLTGFAYGAIIAVYPAAISYLFGAVPGIKAYGRVFTAWGFFGLVLPWLAGYLFDQSGKYGSVILIAAAISLISAAAAWRLPDAKASSA